jgi:predicted transcriptional regulator
MVFRQRKPYRDKIAIFAEILEMAGAGVKRTNVLYRAGLSSSMLNRYLGLMMDAKLVDLKVLDNTPVLKATDRGMEFLHHSHAIMKLLETGDGNRHKPYSVWQAT